MALKLRLFDRKAAPEHDAVVVVPVQQPEDMDEEDRQLLRAAAQLEVQTSIAMRDRLITEIATSARWVQASLLVVNGGAAVAVLQSEGISTEIRIWSGAFFIVGVILSLFTAWVGVNENKDVPKRLSETIGYWIRVSINLRRSEEIERDWLIYASELQKRGRLSRTLGYLSVAAFGVGCAIIGTAGF
jgi:hypothetical protein